MRRQFITHPKFQTSFTLAFVVGVLLIFLIVGGTHYMSLRLLINDPLFTEAQKAILRGFSKELLVFLAYLTSFSVLVFLLVGLYLSYKFVGPLYRLESWLEEKMANSSLPDINLRPGDELDPIAKILVRITNNRGHH